MKTPITKKRIQDHISYCWWKYVIVAAVAILGWNIVYSMTAYRTPEEKKVILGVYSSGSETNVTAYMQEVNRIHLPDMEDVSPMYILPDTQYGEMILSTRIAARECDIYVLPREQFQSYAAQGAFMPLDVMLPDLVATLEEAGVSLSRGWRTVEETGEKHLYGIPCADLPGAMSMLYTDTSDMYIGVFFETGNDDNVLKFMDILIRDLLNEPPVTPTDLEAAQ